jgi:hypothetical protein
MLPTANPGLSCPTSSVGLAYDGSILWFDCHLLISGQERDQLRTGDEDFDEEAEANLTDEEKIEFSLLREVLSL